MPTNPTLSREQILELAARPAHRMLNERLNLTTDTVLVSKAEMEALCAMALARQDAREVLVKTLAPLSAPSRQSVNALIDHVRLKTHKSTCAADNIFGTSCDCGWRETIVTLARGI